MTNGGYMIVKKQGAVKEVFGSREKKTRLLQEHHAWGIAVSFASRMGS